MDEEQLHAIQTFFAVSSLLLTSYSFASSHFNTTPAKWNWRWIKESRASSSSVLVQGHTQERHEWSLCQKKNMTFKKMKLLYSRHFSVSWKYGGVFICWYEKTRKRTQKKRFEDNSGKGGQQQLHDYAKESHIKRILACFMFPNITICWH